MSEISNAFKITDGFSGELSGRLFNSTLTIINNQMFMQSQISKIIGSLDGVGKSINSLLISGIKPKIDLKTGNDSSHGNKDGKLGFYQSIRDAKDTFTGKNKSGSHNGRISRSNKALDSKGITPSLGKLSLSKANIYIKVATAIYDKMNEVNSRTALDLGVARSYGVDIKTYQAWKGISAGYGGNAEDFGDNFLAFKQNISKMDSPEMQDALTALGVKLTDLAGLNTQDQFKFIMDKIVSSKDEAVASTAASTLLSADPTDIMKVSSFIKASGMNFSQLMAEEQSYNVLDQHEADRAFRSTEANRYMSIAADSRKAVAASYGGGINAAIVETVTPREPKKILTEEEEKEEKGYILRSYMTGRAAYFRDAKRHANDHGFDGWFDSVVNTPGTRLKLLEREKEIERETPRSERGFYNHNYTKKLNDALISVIDGEPNDIYSGENKSQPNEIRPIAPQSNTKTQTNALLSTTLSQASPENLRPIINDQSNKSVDIHIYAAAGQSEMDIANNIVARVNDLDIFNGASGNNAMYDVAVA